MARCEADRERKGRKVCRSSGGRFEDSLMCLEVRSGRKTKVKPVEPCVREEKEKKGRKKGKGKEKGNKRKKRRKKGKEKGKRRKRRRRRIW